MLIKELSNIAGVSGNEGAVRKFIRRIIETGAEEIRSDSMGNLLVKTKGKVYSGMPTLMLCAHMDEVGLMVTAVEKSGHLRFKKVGAIDDRVLVAKSVLVGEEKIPGVIGSKAIHLQLPEERKKAFEVKTLLIDIGAKSQKEAEKLVKVGDYISFDTECVAAGEDYLMGKAFDDRAGCAALIELINTKDLPSFYAAFTVQEEVGLRGAKIAAYSLKPEVALVLEGTSAGDVPHRKEHQESTCLGAGPAISFMDASLIADRALFKRLGDLAEKNEIPCQLRRFTGAGTDGGAVAASRKGVKTAVLSVPCRYIHSPCSVMRLGDYNHTRELAALFVKSFAD